MGRVLTDQRTTNSVTKTVSYTHNLDGTLARETYPSGRVLTYPAGGAELPLSAADNTTTYVANAAYAPQGALALLTLGGGIINLGEVYNSRVQPARIQAMSAGGTDLLDLAYDFGLGTADDGTVNVIANLRDNNRTQYFAYDALNRTVLANTQGASGPNCWGQAFGYDPWGNLTTVNLTQCSAPPSPFSLSVNGNNQITNAGFTYDLAGDVLTDGVSIYTWDAQGRQTSSYSASSGTVNYTYDGDGRRVKKSSGTLYWYDLSGRVLTETDTMGDWQNEYIYFDDRRIGAVGAYGEYLLYADALGSGRIITSSSGVLCYDADFYPFGGERVVQNNCVQNYHYKFTGLERDTETGNDKTPARMYSSNFGRWFSPDPASCCGFGGNPQSHNRYAYVRDNPANGIDPRGDYGCIGD